MIPGNERAIANTNNHLFKRGAEVFYEKVSEIHVSGHASKEELKLMLNLIKPKFFIPVHGEYRHLVYHAQLAGKVNKIPKRTSSFSRTARSWNLPLIRRTARDLWISAGCISMEKSPVRAWIRAWTTVVLRDRRKLAHDGIVIVILSIEKGTGTVVSGPDIVSRGFVFEDMSQDLLTEVKMWSWMH